jgi:hypothetical protein
VPLFAVWCNLHGGFVLGLLTFLLFIAVLVLTRRKFVLPAVIWSGCLLATAVNPYGFVPYWRYLIEALSMSRTTISEWRPLYANSSDLISTLALLLPVALAVLFRLRKPDLMSLAFISFSLYCTVRHTRFLVFLAITLAIFGAPYVAALLNKITNIAPQRALRVDRMWSLIFCLLAAVSVVKLTSAFYHLPKAIVDLSSFPVGALTALRQNNTSGRLLVDFNAGAFALWTLYPRMQVSMDGRYETVYPERTRVDNDLALFGSLAQGNEAVARLNPTHILWPNTAFFRLRAEGLGSGWRQVYQDSNYVVIAREDEALLADVGPINTDQVWTPRF